MIPAVTQSSFTKHGVREPEHAILANLLSQHSPQRPYVDSSTPAWRLPCLTLFVPFPEWFSCELLPVFSSNNQLKLKLLENLPKCWQIAKLSIIISTLIGQQIPQSIKDISIVWGYIIKFREFFSQPVQMTLRPSTEKHSIFLCETSLISLLGKDSFSKLKELIGFVFIIGSTSEILTNLKLIVSSKGFLPTVVDIMVIWVKFTHSSPF